jgi:diguanylate cyclase (GGDEF)-like protein
MSVEFTLQERSALFGLLAENSTDIILKTDRRGFVLDGSSGIGRLGLTLPAMLFGPHLRDLFHPACGDLIAAEHDAVIERRANSGWLELPALLPDGGCHWREVQLSCLVDPVGRAYGSLVMSRCIAVRKSLEDRLFAAHYTDPLTRLTNRLAFVSMLDHLATRPDGGCLALFDLDRFAALNLRHGQGAGDDMLCATADLLRAMTRNEDTISRIDGERFGVLLPGLSVEESVEECRPIVETMAAAGAPAHAGEFPITVSVGVAAIDRSTDYTLKRAEIALCIAKAKGRSRVEADTKSWQMLTRCA